ncbi:ribosome hibernation-promoting factor, HPF/YfiA family [Nocardia sp. CA-151230]|uniref:ribosome hibernation-promoting factor, HPF/YfiA family n=1 Tax=Nocardia sp. CA-151230 TaxID=3239982 RepID=UPI003D8F6547
MTTTSRLSAKNADTTVLLDDEVISDDSSTRATIADVVVKGRTLGEGGVPDHFRIHVADKLSRLERFDPTIYLFDVELTHERNRRQRKNCQRIEITARGKGPVVRAEARADSFYAALEFAVEKLESRLRRLKDRRRVHHGDKTPISVSEATASLIDESLFSANGSIAHDHPADEMDEAAGPGHVVRTKQHSAIPMTVDDALYQMELVGHDFFLFQDKETDRPSVVYRRHAFDYGLIRLA